LPIPYPALAEESLPVAKSDRDAASTVKSFLSRVKKKNADEVGLDTSLYAEGVGLDSLDVAELSAVLEDEFGEDPFSVGQMPETIAAIAAFYDEKPAADA
jgi:acyl carrier protein